VRILLIEDDRRQANRLVRALEENGHKAVTFRSEPDGIRASSGEPRFDIAVVDLSPWGSDAVELVRAMREAGCDIPLLLLSGRGEVEDRVEGLRAGADVYLVRPYALAEFLARVDSLGRRVERPTMLEWGGVVVDAVSRTTLIQGSPVALTRTEFNLLEYLILKRGRVVTRSQLRATIWNSDLEGHTRVVDVYVHYLRRKLADAGVPDLIETVRKVGYSIGR